MAGKLLIGMRNEGEDVTYLPIDGYVGVSNLIECAKSRILYCGSSLHRLSLLTKCLLTCFALFRWLLRFIQGYLIHFPLLRNVRRQTTLG